MKRILIIEDDQEIAELERDYLEASGFSADIVGDGLKGRDAALKKNYDLILLDLMLPGLDGFNLCRDIRKAKDVPILMISARQTDIDKVRGFGLGADDYITKPFSPSEMVARVKAHLQRYEQLTSGKKPDSDKPLVEKDLELYPASCRVLLHGKEIYLPHREFQLLEFLMENAGIVFSRDTLFERLWGLDAIGDTNTVSVHINRLREKIEDDSAHPYYIETVRGAGYRFHAKS